MRVRARSIQVVAACAGVVFVIGIHGNAAAQLIQGNTVAQWNKVAEDSVVASGAFINEGQIYMAYEATAVYNAVVAIEGGYRPLDSTLSAPAGASADCAVVEAAYRTLRFYFAAVPAIVANLDARYAEALTALDGCVADGGAGTSVGLAAANEVIYNRTTGPNPDGMTTPIGTTSTFPTRPPGPGAWRLTPPYLPPQTPWVADVRPFVLESADQFLPDPPPSLGSAEWVAAFEEIKAYGSSTSTVRSAAQTATALFWTQNAMRQYNRVVREVAAQQNLGLAETARFAAMIDVVGADAQISVMHAKYHYLFWRPVTAIDPTSVTADGFGPVPGFDDGNSATLEQTGWRPLLATPNHPEYPAAHGSFTGAMAEVLAAFYGVRGFDLVIHGFDAAGMPGNFDAVKHFTRPNDLWKEIIDARTWAGFHYHFSGVAGVVLGRNVAKYDLRHAFQPVDGR